MIDTSTSEIGPGVGSVHVGSLSLMSNVVIITETVLISLRGVVPVVIRKAYKLKCYYAF